MSEQDGHKKILDKMHDIYVAKNHDYDDAFSYIYQKYGQNHALAMIETKFRRLESLNNKKAQVANENALDTLYDLANYAVLTIMEMDKEDSKTDSLFYSPHHVKFKNIGLPVIKNNELPTIKNNETKESENKMTTELKKSTEIKEAKNNLLEEIEKTLIDKLEELHFYTKMLSYGNGDRSEDTLVQMERVYDCVSEVFDNYTD